MIEEFKTRLRDMPDAKRLAVAIYGESVASYRYGVLADKARSDEHRRLFAEMQREERGHQQAIERLLRKHYPGEDFVLTAEDKDLVIVGARMLELKDEASFRTAMRFLHDTEMRTGQFYDALHELMPAGEIGRFLKQMAAECVEHGNSLLKIEPPQPE